MNALKIECCREMYSNLFITLLNCQSVMEGGLKGSRKPKVMKKLKQYDAHIIRHFQKYGFKKRHYERMLKHPKYENLHETHSADDVVNIIAQEAFANTSELSTNFRTNLELVGFRKPTVDRLMDIIYKPLQDESYTVTQLFEVCISYLAGKYEPIINPRSHQQFLVNLTTFDEWRDHDGHMSYNVHDTTPDHAITTLKHIRKKDNVNTKLYMFHATNWRSYESIHELGVNHAFGRPCLDFGVLNAFYMNPSSASALEYAQKSRLYWGNETCILVFEVPESFITCQSEFESQNMQQFKHVCFKRATDEWQNLVSSSRKCKDRGNALDKADFVYGPMVANPNDVKNGHATPKTHHPPKFQLASKRDKGDDFLSENHVGTLFFKRYEIN